VTDALQLSVAGVQHAGRLGTEMARNSEFFRNFRLAWIKKFAILTPIGQYYCPNDYGAGESFGWRRTKPLHLLRTTTNMSRSARCRRRSGPREGCPLTKVHHGPQREQALWIRRVRRAPLG
jgi:hypothetical protein